MQNNNFTGSIKILIRKHSFYQKIYNLSVIYTARKPPACNITIELVFFRVNYIYHVSFNNSSLCCHFKNKVPENKNFPLHVMDSTGRQDFMQHCSCEDLTSFSFSFSIYFALLKPAQVSLHSRQNLPIYRQRTTSSPKRKTNLCYCIVVREHPG